MKNPFAPRIHIEVFVNRGNNITIRTIPNDDQYEQIVVIQPNQIDDLILALQACQAQLKK